MYKLLLLLVLSLSTGCASYYYPAGATPYEKWQIDRYYEDRLNQQINSFNSNTTRKYCTSGRYCY